jgi:hypothetical protein
MPLKIVFLISLFILMGCTHDSHVINKDELTVENFKDNLKADMDYNSITAVFGTPDGDIGSGIHIYVWALADSTEIGIGYTDKILYARHMNTSHVLLETLI